MRTETANDLSGSPGFVIVGPGRSGSGYIAQVLRECGIRCGHENWWYPDIEGAERINGLDGDSSWCALGLGLGGYEGIVLGQVRHPAATMTSLAVAPPHGAYRDLYVSKMGSDPDDRYEWAALATSTFLDLTVGAADMLWRVEDLSPRGLTEIVRAVGGSVSPLTAINVSMKTSRLVNAHRNDTIEASLDDINSSELRDRIEDHVVGLGYA